MDNTSNQSMWHKIGSKWPTHTLTTLLHNYGVPDWILVPTHSQWHSQAQTWYESFIIVTCKSHVTCMQQEGWRVCQCIRNLTDSRFRDETGNWVTIRTLVFSFLHLDTTIWRLWLQKQAIEEEHQTWNLKCKGPTVSIKGLTHFQ